MADVDENVADDFVENEAVHELTAVKKRKHRQNVNFKLEAIEYAAENSGEKAAKRFGVDSKRMEKTEGGVTCDKRRKCQQMQDVW